MYQFTRRIGEQWQFIIEPMAGYSDYSERMPDVGCTVELHTGEGERVVVVIGAAQGDRLDGVVNTITDARTDEQPIKRGQRIAGSAPYIMTATWHTL